MNHTIKISLFGAALAALALPVVAQNTPDPNAPKVNSQTIQERKHDQQERIADGVKSGQLTSGEATDLERKEAGLNREENQMKQQNGGKLNYDDKKQLTEQQNGLSKQISADKHNSNVRQAPTTEVGKREMDQQGRIAQGVASGQLTAGEAKNLERGERGINNEIKNDRAANGGKLTNQQRAQVNRQQNKMSQQIYKDKHNARKR
jgi:hypothetical protein